MDKNKSKKSEKWKRGGNKNKISNSATQKMQVHARTPSYDRYKRYSQFRENNSYDGIVGKYSRYPGLVTILIVLVGILAGLPSIGNAYVDQNGLAGSSAAHAWLGVAILSAAIASIVYGVEVLIDANLF